MKVSFIRVGRDPFNHEYSEIEYYDLKGDREQPSKPSSSFGWYYYPSEHGVPVAFEYLRNAMIERASQEIESLQRDIEALKKLKVPT